MKTSIVFAAAASAASTAIELVGSSGTWTSPNYPGAYKGKSHQQYFKSVGPKELLVLEFVEIDIEYDASCSFDYLMINGNKICNLVEDTMPRTTTIATSTTTTQMVYRFATTDSPPVDVDTSKPMCLTDDLNAVFHSDKVFHYGGFKINYKIKDLCSYKCQQADILAKQAANC